MDAVLVVSSVTDTSRTAGNWYMVNLGYTISNGDPAWYLTEGSCLYSIETDNSIGQKTTLEMDIADRMTIGFTAKPTSGSLISDLSLVYPTYSNTWLLLTKSTLKRSLSPAADVLQVDFQTRTSRKSVTALRVIGTVSSLLCDQPTLTVLIFTGCSSRKRLVFWYPESISTQDYLYGKPEDKDGRNLLVELETNYRPPSDFGTAIPISKHIYNADPSKPRPNDRFNISKTSGVYQQCLNKMNRVECGCTEDMKLTADAAYTDCREKVYRMSYPGELKLNLTLRSQWGTEVGLSDRYAVKIQEVNNRTVTISDSDGTPSDLVMSLRASEEFNYTVYDPQKVTIHMDGSGLYHFRTDILPGISFCPLYTEFQVYIDSTSIPYPVMFIINLSTAFLLGGAFFLAYLYYLSKNNKPRRRALGERCSDSADANTRTGKYPPSLYHREMPSEVE